MAFDAEIHRLTADEYHQLIESGGFDEDSRIELVDGLLFDMRPKTPQHEKAIAFEIVTELTADHIGLAPIAVADVLAAAG